MSPQELAILQGAALEQGPTGVLIITRDDRRCVYANISVRELLRFTAIESLDLNNCFCSVERDGFMSFNESLLNSSGSFMNVFLKTMQDSWLIVNLTVNLAKSNGADVIVLSFQDLTLQLKMQRDLGERENEIRTAYEELLKQNEQLKELDKAKDKFIGLMTHELRTPLASVTATIDFIKQGFYTDETQLKELVATAAEQGAHLGRLVNDILDFSKLQAGKMDFYLQECPPALSVHSSIEAFDKHSQKAHVRLRVEESVDQAPPCYFDDMRIRQILDNIISNAIKFNRENGEVVVSAQWTEQMVTVSIRDTGRGIPPQDLSRVFDEFETLGQLSKHQEGTGLGMPISRRLIERMGGQIGVTSEVGTGSVFSLTLPRQKILEASLYRARPSEEDLLVA